MTNTSKSLGAVCTALTLCLSMAQSAAAGQSTAASLDNLDWVSGGPGVQFAQVWGDWTKGEYGMFVKMEAGYTGIKHSHSFPYHGVTVDGTWVHTFADGTAAQEAPGGYLFQPEKINHSDACMGPEDCLIYINQLGAQDFIPAAE